MIRRSIAVFVGAFALTFSGVAHAQQASICKDGSSTPATGKGTCSGHGGVDSKATKAANKQIKAAEKQAEKSAKASEKATEKTAKATEKATEKTTKAARKTAETTPNATVARTAPSVPSPRPSAPAPTPTPVPERRSAPAPRAPQTQASSRRGEDNDATDAIAKCRDGMYSHAANHRGACSRHGGVAQFLKP